ncbi:MAG: hypothetical protein E7358_04635 [Clostridiales bacterium]|nr:hypothetical protein [Clostridiales bacterium]
MDKFEKLNQFMNQRKKKYVITILVVLAVFIAIFSIVLVALDLGDMIIPFILGLIGAYVWLGIFYALYVFKRLDKNKSEIIKTMHAAELNYQKYKNQLKEMGFVTSKHYSGFGYKWVEFRNILNLVDNLHLEIDEVNKKVAYYFLYLDGDSDIYIMNFSDLISTRLESEEISGKIVKYAVTIKVKHEIGEIGLPVNDNEGFILNSEKGLNYQNQAKQLMTEINKIIIEG